MRIEHVHVFKYLTILCIDSESPDQRIGTGWSWSSLPIYVSKTTFMQNTVHPFILWFMGNGYHFRGGSYQIGFAFLLKMGLQSGIQIHISIWLPSEPLLYEFIHVCIVIVYVLCEQNMFKPKQAGPRSLMDRTLNPLGFSLLWFEPCSGHMWESQVQLMDGQMVFPWVLPLLPTFDECSVRYKWNILERAVKPKSKKKNLKNKK